MIDPAKLAAFAAVTGLTTLTPGPQMLFVLTQSAWRGGRAGLAALAGMQLGNATWFVMAGLGLGTLARAAPALFTAVTLAGAAYLGWLGISAIRHAGKHEVAVRPGRGAPSHHAFRDAITVALSNPKSLVYVTALLPPFVDLRQPVAPQLLVLAAVAIGLDLAIGTVYVAAGNRLSAAIEQPQVRVRLDRAIGSVFLMIAAGVLYATYASQQG
jgi:homoserine/homoserine lactone efflux protein